MLFDKISLKLSGEKERKREREKERKREREKERKRDREIERKWESEKERKREREKERKKDGICLTTKMLLISNRNRILIRNYNNKICFHNDFSSSYH